MSDDDYIHKTIAAYDASPEKFYTATEVMSHEQEMQELLRWLPGAKLPILDAGCAYGRDCALLESMGFHTIGIDLSDKLLEHGRAIHPELDLRKMDIRKLDFADASFSGVWCNAVLLHLRDADLQRALEELHRVLVPGGAIAISVKEGEGSREVMESFSSNHARFYNFKSMEQMRELLKNHGFLVHKSFVLNEKDRFGPNARDLSWVWCIATKL